MSDRLTRRQFVKEGVAATAALATSLGAAEAAQKGGSQEQDTSKILNYNPDMEYRRCGKTEWMVSAVCLGGHWKRVDKMVPGV